MYGLTGVVHHTTNSTRSGHCTTYVRTEDKSWRLYDDANVATVERGAVLADADYVIKNENTLQL